MILNMPFTDYSNRCLVVGTQAVIQFVEETFD